MNVRRVFHFLILNIFISTNFISGFWPFANINTKNIYNQKTNGFGQNFEDIKPLNKLTPESINELQKIVQDAFDCNKKISILGAGKSQGGQVIANEAIMIDTSKLNKIISLDFIKQEITVQVGMTWKQLQNAITPHGLAVKSMQSYADFSIGGSIGVNAHGQDFNSGPVSNSIISFKILMADGKILNCSRDENLEIFKLALGGYGLIGIIFEVTLSLTQDVNLEKQVYSLSTSEYLKKFLNEFKFDENIALNSARLSISSNDLFEKVLVINYKFKSLQEIPNRDVFEPNNTKRDQFLLNGLRKFNWFKKIRFFFESNLLEKQEITTRNEAMSSSIINLENKLYGTRDILQEYFIPAENMEKFIMQAKKIILENNVNILNGTIRFVKKIKDSYLSYADYDCFALVLFINVIDNKEGYENAQKWSSELIDLALNCNGKFYLPYQLFASSAQIRKSYPFFDSFVLKKKQYDPKEIFINELYKKYV